MRLPFGRVIMMPTTLPPHHADVRRALGHPPVERVCAFTLARTPGHLLLLALADLDGVKDVDLAMVEVDGKPFATETVDLLMCRYCACGVAHRTNPAQTRVETPATARGFPVRSRPLGLFSDDQYYEFCRLNSDLDIERTADGDLLIMAPRPFGPVISTCASSSSSAGGPTATGPSGDRVLRRIRPAQFRGACAGCGLDSTRPSYDRAARAAGPLSPAMPGLRDLRSPSDTLDAAQAKMREYLENGLQLGWLIDPFARRVYVYRPDAVVDVLDNPDSVDGAPILPGFRLDLSRVW